MTVRTFHLERDEDTTGISGTGRVAEGVQFTDGEVVLRWQAGEYHSTVVWAQGIEAVEQIHGHGGRTRIVWHDEDDAEVRDWNGNLIATQRRADVQYTDLPHSPVEDV